MNLRRRLVTAAVARLHRSLRKVHDLRYLFLEVTLDCNLACLHCGSDCIRDKNAPHLDPDLVLDTLARIAGRYDASRITVAVTGGEPLLHPRLWELGAAITKLGFPWGMVSNGWAWTDARIAAAEKAGLRTLTISLDGLRDTHDWFRGREGSYDRAVDALRRLVAADFLETFDVVTCVHPRNLDQLDELRGVLAVLGVPRWRIFTISPKGRAAQNPLLQLPPTDFRRLMDWIEAAHGDGGRPFVHYSEAGYLGAYEQRVRGHRFFCQAGVSVGGILVDGGIMACPNIDRGFVQGNVREDDFVEVWEKRFQPFRDREWMREGECEGCDEWALCQGSAFHLWEPSGRGPLVCHVKRFGLLADADHS
jgi:radical SAM enzyme (rSAM/lipoprotein system)